MGSRIEKISFAIIWFGVLVGLRILMPVQNVDSVVKVQYCLASTVVWFGLYYIYIKLRNRFIMKKISKYAFLNEFEERHKYLDKYIYNYPNLKWLRFEKLMTFALQGKITDYRNYLTECNNCILKTSVEENVEQFNNLFSYFTDENITSTKKQRYKETYISKVNFLLLEKSKIPKQEIENRAIEIYNSPCFLFKAFATLFLAEFYYENGDVQNLHIYAIKAREYSKSNELSFYVEKRLQKLR